MKITEEIRGAIVASARAQIEETGRVHVGAIASAVGCSSYGVSNVLRPLDQRGELARTCTQELPGGKRCCALLPEKTRGNLTRTRCASHSGFLPSDSPEIVAAAADEPMLEAPSVVLRVDEVRGWPLAVVRGASGEEARLGHFETARRLGYADAKDLLAIARRIWPDFAIRVPCADRPRADGLPGRPRREYLFSRTELLKLACRSETSAADAIQDEIIAVFEAWLDGKLKPTPRDDVALASAIGNAIATTLPAAMATAMAPFVSRLDRLESRPIIGADLKPGEHATIDGHVVVNPDRAQADGKLTVTDIARRVGLPMDPAARERSKNIVSFALKLKGLLHNRGFCVVLPLLQTPATGAVVQRDQYYYVPDVLGHLKELVHAASVIRGEFIDSQSWTLAFDSGRKELKRLCQLGAPETT